MTTPAALDADVAVVGAGAVGLAVAAAVEDHADIARLFHERQYLAMYGDVAAAVAVNEIHNVTRAVVEDGAAGRLDDASELRTDRAGRGSH